MGRDVFHLRHLFAQEVANFRQVGQTRTNDETLPAAIMFPQQRLAQHHRIKRQDKGANGEPVHGRRCDDGKIADTGHGKLQCAGNRRRRQGQHMHIGAELLEPFLVGDTEMLLLIDDDKPKILEFDGFRQQRMGADDDIHLA